MFLGTVEDRNCKQQLRFESLNVDFLAAEILVEKDWRSGGIYRRREMEIFMRFVGDPGFQSGVAQDLGVHRTTANKIIRYVMNQINENSHRWIRFPLTAAEINDARLKWQRRFILPTVVGALDCTQIEIVKPGQHGDEYICRKGYPSINVQATCNSLEQFTSISAEWPGSVHDSRIWRNSDVRGIISQFDGSACLLGDSGYGISPWLITPFKPARTHHQRQFNLLHCQERVIIERCFGQLKRRFPILGNCVRISLQNIPKLVVSCAVLHNIAKHLNDEMDVEDLDVTPDEAVEEEHVIRHENPVTARRGTEKREQMMQFLHIQ